MHSLKTRKVIILEIKYKIAILQAIKVIEWIKLDTDYRSCSY